ncbi:RNA polymerase sigma-70 factor [Sphingobacterium mizutaii]|uniref:RNA polymerase sigma-70 factor n=1 Tax=Sphingobacterium mizutaii TaxID=1010 RepID=UPI00162AA304|nr:RNA polymerase sigma-70 factor [Sphingobacterium mizutaii]
MGTVVSLFKLKFEESRVYKDFETLYEEFWENLFKQVIRILPDEDDVVEVVQQTFLDLWEIRERIPQIKSLKSFLFIMARNLAFKQLKERLKSEQYRDYYASHFTTISNVTERQIEFKELNTILEDHINNLPERMKEIFLLSRKSNLSYIEIAQHLNISDKTVKKQINNALKILKVKIDQDYIPYLLLILVFDMQ